MPAPYNPPWGRGSSGRRASQVNPSMRVSHAERTEVADRLSKHYGDGRLDEEEFNERLDRAMKAKTQSDLDGLFDDLPVPPDRLPRAGGDPRDHGGTMARPPVHLPVRGVLAARIPHPLAADRDRGVPVVALRPLAPPLAAPRRASRVPAPGSVPLRCRGRPAFWTPAPAP